MTVTIGHTTFDRVDYDEDADVLYLHVGDPGSATDFEDSAEGHALRFDADGRLVGLTLVNPRALLVAGGPLTVTIPERVVIDPAVLAAAVHAV